MDYISDQEFVEFLQYLRYRMDTDPGSVNDILDKAISDANTCVRARLKQPTWGCGHFLGPFILQCPPPIMQLTVPNSVGIELDSFLRVRV